MPPRAYSFALVTAVTALPLTAQSASLTAATPITVSAQHGAQTASQTLPAGPLPAVLQHSAGTPAALGSSATLWTEFQSSQVSLGANVRFALLVPATNSSAAISPSELVLDLSSPAGQPMWLHIEGDYYASAGLPTPLLIVDVFDDGVPDYSLQFPATPGPIGLPGGVNVPTRITLSSSTVMSGRLEVGVRLTAVPANTVINSFGGQCALLQYGLQPRFDGGLSYSTSAPSQFTPVAVVFGLAPMPQLLGSAVGIPCIGLPRPDIVILHPFGGGDGTLAIPQAARPIRLYTQAIMPSGNAIRTSEAFTINAN